MDAVQKSVVKLINVRKTKNERTTLTLFFFFKFHRIKCTDREDTIYNIGADKNCPKNVEKMYCNGPLRPVTNYRLKLRAFTTNGLQDSWTVPFTTRMYLYLIAPYLIRPTTPYY